MAKLTSSGLVKSIRGHVGNLVFRQTGDKLILTERPGKRTKPATDAQAAVQAKFKLAVVYAKVAMANPALQAVYAPVAAAEGKSIYCLMIRDFFVPSVVDSIDVTAYTGQPGEAITIQAHDDIAVVSVTVRILDANNNLVEQGAATLVNGAWVYTTTAAAPAGQALTIEATATDNPAHTGMLTVLKP
jgi:hypothetical protein